MVELCLYIGPPKTGTTTLQDYFARHHAAYLGKRGAVDRPSRAPDHPNVPLIMGALQALAAGESARADGYLAAWRREIAAHVPAAGTSAVYALEEIARPVPRHLTARMRVLAPVTDPAEIPVLELLRRLARDPAPFSRVRVLATVREQADWLASRYAHEARSLAGPSQADFEARVTRLLAAGDVYGDWEFWRAALAARVGAENVAVVPLELLHTAWAGQQLAALTELASGPPGTGQANSRRESPGQAWPLTRRNRGAPVGEAINRLLQDTRLGVAWPAFARAGKHAGRVADPIAVACYGRRREPAITIPDTLRARIRTAFGTSNQILAERLGVDLHGLGY